MPRVVVKFFARYREIVGKSEFEFYTNGNTLNEIIKEISKDFPEIPWNEALISVNHRYASKDVTISDGDIISIYPPVSGG